jgi:hypothetical protein
MCIDTTIKQMKYVLSYFEKYWKEGFTKNMDPAKVLHLKRMLSQSFQQNRHMIRKKNLEKTTRNMNISHQMNH